MTKVALCAGRSAPGVGCRRRDLKLGQSLAHNFNQFPATESVLQPIRKRSSRKRSCCLSSSRRQGSPAASSQVAPSSQLSASARRPLAASLCLAFGARGLIPTRTADFLTEHFRFANDIWPSISCSIIKHTRSIAGQFLSKAHGTD